MPAYFGSEVVTLGPLGALLLRRAVGGSLEALRRLAELSLEESLREGEREEGEES